MKVIYTHTPYSIISNLIRLFTFSKFSHCAIYISDKFIVDSTFTTGVRINSVEDYLREFPYQEIVEIEVPDDKAAAQFALAQVGKPYDWTALVSIVLQRNWQEPDRWFCSELVEATLAAGGTKRFRDTISRITPQESWGVL